RGNSMSVQTYTPNQTPITMTEKALAHLEKQIAKAGHGIGMRLGTKKNGCSGLAYTVDIIDAAEADDQIYQVSEQLIVAVSPKHFPFVQGTQIDFVKEGLNQHFKFINPNEKGGCGCGESFTV